MFNIARFKTHNILALWLSLVVLCIINHHFLFKIDLNNQLYLFIFFALTLGMYHGLLDVILLKVHQRVLKKMTIFSPILLYIITVIAGLCIFILLPFITIPILLVVTVWHFGEEQGEQKYKNVSSPMQKFTTRLMIGGASISLPFLFAFKQLNQLLKLILADQLSYDLALLAWQIISYAWLLVLCCYLIYWLLIALLNLFTFKGIKYVHEALVAKKILNFKQLIALCILFLSFYLLPLLLAFTLYFTAYHSLQHVADIHHGHRVRWFLQPILIVSLASIVLLIGAFYVFPAPQYLASTALKYPAVILSAIIALLTAITIPHATLISIWRSKLLNSHQPN